MSRRRGRILLIILALIVLLPLLAVGGVLLAVDPNGFKPRIEAAVRQATGRDLVLRGPLSFVPSLSPKIAAQDVTLANAPGGSRPEMVTLQRMEAKVALLPLLSGRVEIARLMLVRPDILLETDAAGQGNWRFAPPAPTQVAANTASTPEEPGRSLVLKALEVTDGRIVWHNGQTGASRVVDLKRLTVSTPSATDPLTLAATATVDGAPVQLSGTTGSWARLQDRQATTPWDVNLAATLDGARLTAVGGLTQPMQGRGYALHVEGSVADASTLSGLAGMNLPPVRDVAFSGQVADSGGPIPAVTALVLRARDSDLGNLVPGLRLSHAEIGAPALDQPVQADIAGLVGAAKLHVSAHLGPPAALLPGAKAAPFPVDVVAEAAGATLGVKGSIAEPARLGGVDLAVAGSVPDLAALSPLAGRPLPDLKPIAFQAHLADREGALSNGLILRDFGISSPQAEVAGNGTLTFTPRRTVQANLAARHVDLDALQSAFANVAPTVPANAAAPGAAGSPPANVPQHLIPDTPINFAALEGADADVNLAIGELRSGGITYRDMTGHVVLTNGRLSLDQFTGQLPGGKLDLKLGVDAHASPPPVSLTLKAPGLAMQPLLAAFRLPADLSGKLEVNADLRGVGTTPHAIAASLNGQLGLAMVDGEIGSRLLGGLLADVLKTANVANDVSRATKLRCLAVRADIAQGVASVSTLVLDSSRVTVQGAGTVNLGEETLGLRLRPTLLVGGPGLTVPVRVGGTLRNPKFESDNVGTAQSVASFAAGLAANKNNALAGLAAAAAGGAGGGAACGPALTAARMGQPGEMPSTPAAPPPAAASPGAKPPKPADLLRSFLR